MSSSPDRLLAAVSLVLLVVSLALAPAFAETPVDPVEETLQRLATTYAAVPTLEADFVQTSTGMSYPETLVQKGVVAVERPGSMLWDFASPTPQQYLSDGSTLWIVDVEGKTCTVYRQMDVTLALYFDFLTGMADVRSHFSVALGEPIEAVDVLVLKPLQKDSTLGTIHVRIDKASSMVTSVLSVTPFGDQSEVVLSNIRTGQDIPDERFVWTAREGFREIEGG